MRAFYLVGCRAAQGTGRKLAPRVRVATADRLLPDSIMRIRDEGGWRVYPVKTRLKAITLVELLCVVTVITVLASLLFPVLQEAVRNGKRTASLTHMREILTAFILYAHEGGSEPALGVDLPGTFGTKLYRLETSSRRRSHRRVSYDARRF